MFMSGVLFMLGMIVAALAVRLIVGFVVGFAQRARSTGTERANERTRLEKAQGEMEKAYAELRGRPWRGPTSKSEAPGGNPARSLSAR